jgi:hypothetical protein
MRKFKILLLLLFPLFVWGQDLTIVSVTGTASLDATAFSKIHNCTGTATDYTLDLPTAVGNEGGSLAIKGNSALTKVVTIQGVSGQLIDGEANRKLSTDGLFVLLSDGANWIVINEVGSWIPYTPTWGGFDIDPTIVRADYFRVGKLCRARVIINGSGTSGATHFTLTVPFIAAEVSRAPTTLVLNAGTTQTGPGLAILRSGQNTVDMYRDATAGTWTASGNKRADLDITFRIQ